MTSQTNTSTVLRKRKMKLHRTMKVKVRPLLRNALFHLSFSTVRMPDGRSSKRTQAFTQNKL